VHDPAELWLRWDFLEKELPRDRGRDLRLGQIREALLRAKRSVKLQKAQCEGWPCVGRKDTKAIGNFVMLHAKYLVYIT